MTIQNDEIIEIVDFDFNKNSINQNLENNKLSHYIKDLWPIVYLIYDNKLKKAYIGETTNALNRMGSHLKNNEKNKLSKLKFIISNRFNKSAALDIESKLISYFTADNKYSLLNHNLGIANHNYYQKNDLYLNIYKKIWDKLIANQIAIHSLEQLNNSDLFKYSPYKNLDFGQLNAINEILTNILDNKIKTTIINGGAGTGKSIIAIYLFKLLNSNIEDLELNEIEDEIKKKIFDKVKKVKKKYSNISMGLIVPMSSFRKTLKRVFSKINGLKSNMVISPTEVKFNNYDVLLVDESHRLRQRVNLGAYFGNFDEVCTELGLNKLDTNELEWVQLKSKNLVLFYDNYQSIKPSDVNKKDFKKLKNSDSTKHFQLYSQFRVKGGEKYSKFISKLLNLELKKNEFLNCENYDFFIFNSFEEFRKQIKMRNSEYTLSRMVSGYSWPWISKNDKKLFDINIEGIKLRWNSKSLDWINSENSVNEVGCIHTTQGYDLNYVGIIFGDEIKYDPVNKEIIIDKNNYFDKNGKNTIKNLEDLKNYILNIYKTLMLRGVKGTYIYVRDENLKTYFSNHIAKFEQEIKKIEIFEKNNEKNNLIPYYEGELHKGFVLYDTDDNFSIKEKYFTLKINFLVNNYNLNIIPENSICIFSNIEGFCNLDGRLILIQDGVEFFIYEFRKSKKESYLIGNNKNNKIKIIFNKEKHIIKGIFNKVLGYGKTIDKKKYPIVTNEYTKNIMMVAENVEEYKKIN